MTFAKRLTWLFLALLAVMAHVRIAQAGVTVPTPAGWTRTNVPKALRARADAWAAGGGGRVLVVMTPRGRADLADNAEILAVIELADALPDDAVAEGGPGRTPALRAAAADLLDLDEDPERDAREALPDDLAMIRGRWSLDSEIIRVALVPSGQNHAAIVMSTSPRSDVLFAAAFDEVLDQVEGANAGIVPFPRERWRAVAVALWIVAAIGTVLLVRAASSQASGRQVGQRAALVLVSLSGLVGTVSYFATTNQEVALAAAGVSRAWFTTELATPGMLLGVLAWIGGTIVESRSSPIDSAPTGGTFAERTRGAGAAGPAGVHVEARPTPLVGVPILPQQADAGPPGDPPARLDPPAAAGTVVAPAPQPPGALAPALAPGVAPGGTLPPGAPSFVTPSGTQVVSDGDRVVVPPSSPAADAAPSTGTVVGHPPGPTPPTASPPAPAGPTGGTAVGPPPMPPLPPHAVPPPGGAPASDDESVPATRRPGSPLRHSTGETKAVLETAHVITEPPRGVPARDAPGHAPPPVGSPSLEAAGGADAPQPVDPSRAVRPPIEAGAPTPVGGELDLSGPASLETAQIILGPRGGPSEGKAAVGRRWTYSEGSESDALEGGAPTESDGEADDGKPRGG